MRGKKLLKAFAAFFLTIYVLACIGLYFMQEKLLFHPPKLDVSHQYSFTNPFKEFNLNAGNGMNINAVKFLAQGKSRGLVLFFHGNAGNIQRIGWIAEEFTTKGYDCIIMDYPQYGKSTGELTEANIFKMARAFYNKAVEEYAPADIILYGRSLGTGVAAHLAAEVDCKSLFLEAPYYSIVDVAQGRFPIFPVGLVAKYPFYTNKALPKVKCPIYAIHGTADNVIPYESAKKLEALNLPNFKLVTVDGGQHANLPGSVQYEQLLTEAMM